MIQLNRQQTKILLLLRQLGQTGVNSWDLTYKYYMKQAPTRVNELREMGFKIISVDQPNRSCNYVLLLEPQGEVVLHGEKPKAVEKPTLVFDEKKQMGVWRTPSEIAQMNKPVQERIFA